MAPAASVEEGARSRSRSPPFADSQDTLHYEGLLAHLRGDASNEDTQGDPSADDAYVGLHSWPFLCLQSLRNHLGDAELRNNCQGFLQRGCIVTSSFSGVGTGELAIRAVFEVLDSRVGSSISTSKPPYMWAACDSNADCRDVLHNHDPKTKSANVFGDLCEALPASWMSAFKQELAQRRARVNAAEDAAERRQVLSSESKAFLERAMQLLKDNPFPAARRCWCHKCQRQCRRFPWMSGDALNMLLLEVAGSICVGFSPMGKMYQFLDDSVIPFFAWVWMMRSVQPHVICHECVPKFDPEVLDWCLNYGFEEPQYHLESLVFNARDLGIPVERLRRYTLCFRIAQTLNHDTGFSDGTFGTVAFRELSTTGNVFFCADEQLLAAERQAMAARMFLPPQDSSGNPWPWTALLTEGEYHRLKKYKRLWLNAELGESSGQDFVFVSLSQNAEFVGDHFVSSTTIPTLIRNTILFRLTADSAATTLPSRLAIPLELLAMQMLPVLLPEGHFFHGLVAFEETFQNRRLSLNSMRSLAGNGMNFAALGSVLLWLFTTTTFHLQPQPQIGP